jgi:hypothetical protein
MCIRISLKMASQYQEFRIFYRQYDTVLLQIFFFFVKSGRNDHLQFVTGRTELRTRKYSLPSLKWYTADLLCIWTNILRHEMTFNRDVYSVAHPFLQQTEFCYKKVSTWSENEINNQHKKIKKDATGSYMEYSLRKAGMTACRRHRHKMKKINSISWFTFCYSNTKYEWVNMVMQMRLLAQEPSSY